MRRTLPVAAACAALAFSALAAGAPAGALTGPFQPDANTLALLHFDGSTADAAGRVRSRRYKKIAYDEGRFGKGLRANAGGIAIGPSGVLDVGGSSWMVECWLRPDPNETRRNYGILGSLLGNGRIMILGISGRKALSFSLGAGPHHPAAVRSGDVEGRLHDGRWHHVAAVVDRRRNGELRLYLDGREVTGKQAAQPHLPTPGTKQVWIAIGAPMPWYIGGENAFRGVIDEVRVSDCIRPGFAAKAGSPMPPPARPLPPRRAEAGIAPDAPASTRPLPLTPAGTRIVVGTFSDYCDRDTATMIQSNLRRAYGVKDGFPIVSDFTLGEQPDARAILAVGDSRFAAAADAEGLEEFGYRVRRRGRAVIFAGGSRKGSLYGTVRFLDECCGVRFYMPGGLFTSRPAKTPVVLGGLDITDAPYVKVGAAHTTGAPGGGEFMRVHGLDRRPTSHQHTMYARFDPAVYARTHPEIYPVIEGRKRIPAPGDQRWQPCFSEPKLVDAGVDSAGRFFRERPDIGYVAFAIMDAHVYCDRDLNSEEVRRQVDRLGEKEGKVQGLSNLYWAWLNKVAERLARTHPEKRIVGLVYASVRKPPPFPLHENIVAWMVFKMSDIAIDKRFTGQGTEVEKWAKTASAAGHHDWTYGHGFLIPRLYTGYIQQTFLQFEKLGAPLRYAYAETGANWGLDGPKLYLMARLWKNPHIDVTAELRQFCDDMFGPASGEMLAYFTLLETLYCDHLNRRTEQKLFRWARQFTGWTDAERAMLAEARGHLDRASAAVKADSDRARRIELFSKTLKLTEMLVAMGCAESVTPRAVEEVREYFAEAIVPDPMTIHARGRREGLTEAILDPILGTVTRGKLPKTPGGK